MISSLDNPYSKHLCQIPPTLCSSLLHCIVDRKYTPFECSEQLLSNVFNESHDTVTEWISGFNKTTEKPSKQSKSDDNVVSTKSKSSVKETKPKSASAAERDTLITHLQQALITTLKKVKMGSSSDETRSYAALCIICMIVQCQYYVAVCEKLNKKNAEAAVTNSSTDHPSSKHIELIRKLPSYTKFASSFELCMDKLVLALNSHYMSDEDREWLLSGCSSNASQTQPASSTSTANKLKRSHSKVAYENEYEPTLPDLPPELPHIHKLIDYIRHRYTMYTVIFDAIRDSVDERDYLIQKDKFSPEKRPRRSVSVNLKETTTVDAANIVPMILSTGSCKVVTNVDTDSTSASVRDTIRHELTDMESLAVGLFSNKPRQKPKSIIKPVNSILQLGKSNTVSTTATLQQSRFNMGTGKRLVVPPSIAKLSTQQSNSANSANSNTNINRLQQQGSLGGNNSATNITKAQLNNTTSTVAAKSTVTSTNSVAPRSCMSPPKSGLQARDRSVHSTATNRVVQFVPNTPG